MTPHNVPGDNCVILSTVTQIKYISGPYHVDESITLGYNTGVSPIALTMCFTSGSPDEDEEVNVWLISRELLREALRSGRAGVADVIIKCEDPDDYVNPRVYVRLSSHDGVGVVIFTRRELEDFLNVTYSLVPEHDEMSYVHMDKAIGKLLEGNVY